MGKIKYYDEVTFDDASGEKKTVSGLLNKLILPTALSTLEKLGNDTLNGTMTADDSWLRIHICSSPGKCCSTRPIQNLTMGGHFYYHMFVDGMEYGQTLFITINALTFLCESNIPLFCIQETHVLV